MSKLIQKLSPKVVKKLRSDIAFTNVAHCVEELVLNAVDAGSSCIAVNLNLPFYQIQVVDNGCGIDAEQMKIIGTRYATSKCHTLEDLENLKSCGFRGEALSSLKEVSSVLMIESRTGSSADTYCKIFTQGKALDPTKSLNSRPSKGTTVTVYDFMYNMPVRRKNISDALDLEDCRKLLQSIALMFPNISFTLKNEATGEMYLQLKKCSSLYHSFLQIFGRGKASNLKNVSYEKNGYEISGCISTDCFISKDLQFLYVNKRHVLRTKLHKLINNVLNKVLSSKQKSNISSNSSTPESASPSKNQCYCVFVLNISCPYDKYDIIFEPRKTMIEFYDWDLVLKLVEDALSDFLKKENLYSSADKSESNQNVVTEKNAVIQNFQVQDCQQGLFSNVVCRLNYLDKNSKNANVETEEKIKETPVNNGEKEDTSLDLNNQNHDLPFTDLSKVKTFVESTDLSNHESSADINNGKTSISLLDNYVSEVKDANSNLVDNNPVSLSADTPLDIPSRSVFPSENPVMLRVPEKSVLSHLQNDSSNSNFLKLKDKLKGFVYRSTNPLDGGKYQKNFEKVSVKLKDSKEKVPPEKESSLSSPLSRINIEKYETKLKECSEKMLSKSSQCPSVSGNYQNIENNVEGRISLKETKNKSLQCPPVSSDKETRVVSRFLFEEKSNHLPSELLKGSKRFKKKAMKKLHHENTEIRNILLNKEVDDNNVSKPKRLKSSNIQETIQDNQHTKDKMTNIFQENDNANMEFDDFRINPNTFDIHTKEFNSSNCTDKLEFVNPPAIFVDEDICRPNIKLKSKQVEIGSFDLQCFNENRNVEGHATDDFDVTESKMNSIQREDMYLEKEINDNAFYSNIDIPQSVYFNISHDIIETVKEIKQKVCYLTDSDDNDFRTSIAGDILMEYEASLENDPAEDKLNPDEAGDRLMEYEASLENDPAKDKLNLNEAGYRLMEYEASVENDPARDKLNPNEAEDSLMEIEASVENDLVKDKLNPNELSSDASYVVGNKMFNPVSTEKNDVPYLSGEICFESSETSEGIEKEMPCLNFKNPVNVDSFDTAGESKLANLNSDNGSPKSSLCKVNFDSDPFTANGSHKSSLCNVNFDSDPFTADGSLKSSLSNIKLDSDPFTAECSLKSSLCNVNFDSDPFTADGSLKSSLCNEKFESYPFTDKLISNLANPVSLSKSNSPENTEVYVKQVQNSEITETSSNMNIETLSSDTATMESEEMQKTKHDTVDNITAEGYSLWKVNSQTECKRKIYIDSATGNSSYIDPGESKIDVERKEKLSEGNFKKSHFFLTHDYSPFLKITQSPVCSKNNAYRVENELEHFIENNEKSERNKKWRVQHECLDNTDNLENKLSCWNNPMFDIPYEVTPAVDGKFYQNIPQMCYFLSSYRFSKKSLETLQVIGQVDSKFIACILKDFNDTCSDKKLLTLFDQHAVHERIRLEELMEDLFEVDENGEKSIKMSTISPIEVSFSEDELRLLRSYNDKLSNIGICLNINNRSNVCTVTSVPLCLVHKDSGELRRSVSDTTNILQNAISEWLSTVVKTRSVSKVLPKTLLSVLNYQACRGAVKFGDPLTVEQCNKLMKSVSLCKLPFQCAHGRPSIAPILDLNKIEAQFKKRAPPNIKKLLEFQEQH